MASSESHLVHADTRVALRRERLDSRGPARGLHVDPGCVESMVHLGVVLLEKNLGVLQKVHISVGLITHVNH